MPLFQNDVRLKPLTQKIVRHSKGSVICYTRARTICPKCFVVVNISSCGVQKNIRTFREINIMTSRKTFKCKYHIFHCMTNV